MTVIVDYGVGNLFSVRNSMSYIGAKTVISGDEKVIRSADRILLPGVGAFADAAEKLKSSGLAELIRAEASSGKPLLGICLGMQLLFERSYEDGITEGLGLIRGEVRPIAQYVPTGYRIPHIGWNALSFAGSGKVSPIFKYVDEGSFFYFAHSYAAFDCGDALSATAEYGAHLTAAVAEGNIFGAQFHPEISGGAGLNMLRAFCEI